MLKYIITLLERDKWEFKSCSKWGKQAMCLANGVWNFKKKKRLIVSIREKKIPA